MAKSLMACIKNHFGMREGKKISDLLSEIKALSPQDRWDIACGFHSGHGTEALLDDSLEKERVRAKNANIVKSGVGYGEIAV